MPGLREVLWRAAPDSLTRMAQCLRLGVDSLSAWPGPQAIALQQAYQAATTAAAGTNASYIGNPGVVCRTVREWTQLLLAPNYQTRALLS